GLYIPIEGSYIVCGGKNGNTTLDSCEFFSIQSLSWTNGPKMKTARKNPPIANLFALSKQGSEKGSVLIAGGEDSSGKALNKVDFYDIQTKSVDDFKSLPVAHSGGIVFFNPTEEPLILAVMMGPGQDITKLLIANQDINWVQVPVKLNFARDGHRFTALPDYRILIAGGGSKTLEIYNYKDDTISLSKELSSDLKGHQIINLSDSNILIAGGADENGNLNEDTFIYNPLTDTISGTGKMNIPRKDFRLTLLHNGKVLASGGIDKNGNTVSQLELYDPGTGQWSNTLSLNIARANHTAELIGPEGVLICGGNSGGNTASIKTCEIYSPEKICAPGSFACDGKWIVKCNSFGDGTNKTNECADGCANGQCIGGCKEGDRRCRDIGVKIIVEICNATGGWVLFQQCEESCKNGYCDGQIPPKDTGITDAGKDSSFNEIPSEDKGVTEDTMAEDIFQDKDAEILSDNTTTQDNSSGKSEADGCSCSLIE
ncbi:MAG: hypothetical protein N3B13_09930, partial [Deltaproteobacteria bacterium]|nr:hypothetical protein [Deltaproteobacteria bacterium]